MPIAVNDKSKGYESEQMWKALKAHILRERQRKKQEREAEVEEERLRKEREAREQQDVMTLSETREQISQLELKLSDLKAEKHQLFVQLKKVLNEDDNRRRQLVNDHNPDMFRLQIRPPEFVRNNKLAFLSSRSVPQSGPIPQPVAPQAFKLTNKRTRSPSPPSAVPVSLYHQAYAYKSVPNGQYQMPPQKEDSRRGQELVRAVLWNKTAQYAAASQPGPYYTVPAPQELVYYPAMSREQPRAVYETPRPQQHYHMDKHVEQHYVLPLAAAQPTAKTGSITSGYPIRHTTQTQYQTAPTAAVRPIYQAQNQQQMSYPQRE